MSVSGETSPITGVNDQFSATVLLYSSSAIPANLADIPNSATLLNPGDSIPNAGFLIVVPQANADVGAPVFSANGTGDFAIANNSGLGEGNYDADGNRIGGAGSYNGDESTSFTFSDQNSGAYIIPVPPTGAYTCMHYPFGGTCPTPVITSGTVLSLTDRTNLDNGAFVVGDVVTGYTADGPPAAFAPVIYTGNGSSQDINCGFAPDLVWIKNRTATGISQHVLMDAVRGNSVMLSSNLTFDENNFGKPPVYGLSLIHI